MLRNLQLEIPPDPGTPFLDIFPEHLKMSHYRDTRTPTFVAGRFPVVKLWSEFYVHPWRNGYKLWSLHTIESYAVIKKDKPGWFVGQCMHRETLMLSDINQTVT